MFLALNVGNLGKDKKNLKILKKILKKPLTKLLGCGILTMQSPKKAFARG